MTLINYYVTGIVIEFCFCSWLDVGEDDGKVERVLKLKGKNDPHGVWCSNFMILQQKYINMLKETFVAFGHASFIVDYVLMIT